MSRKLDGVLRPSDSRFIESSTMNMTSNDLTSRREFLRTSGVAVVAGAITAPFVLTSQAASPGDQIKIGLVGCGGRGSGAVREALHADSNIAVTAMGDAFKSPLDACLKNLQNEKDIVDKVKVDGGQVDRWTGRSLFTPL